jgi:hypothetical protein
MAVSELHSFLYHFGYDLENAWWHCSLSFESNRRIIWTDFDKILDPADLSLKISTWAATSAYFTPSCLNTLYIPCFGSKMTRFSYLLDETTDSATEIGNDGISSLYYIIPLFEDGTLSVSVKVE